MLSRLAMALCGVSSPPDPEQWKKDLRAAGYIVHERHGVWHWYHPPSGAQSGRYVTEHGAWYAAKLDHDHWKETNES